MADMILDSEPEDTDEELRDEVAEDEWKHRSQGRGKWAKPTKAKKPKIRTRMEE
jgi:hypothetical protein